MTISLEILNAFSLSIVFFGVILSVIALGIVFLAYFSAKARRKDAYKMGWLVVFWGAFIFLHLKNSAAPDYAPVWLVYSVEHIISLFIGALIFAVFLCMLSGMLKIYNRKLLFTAGIFTMLSLLSRAIFPFFANPYLSLLQRVFIIIPPLLGIFMIVILLIGGKNGQKK